MRDLRETFNRLGATAPSGPGLFLFAPDYAADAPRVLRIRKREDEQLVEPEGRPPRPGRYIALNDLFTALERPALTRADILSRALATGPEADEGRAELQGMVNRAVSDALAPNSIMEAVRSALAPNLDVVVIASAETPLTGPLAIILAAENPMEAFEAYLDQEREAAGERRLPGVVHILQFGQALCGAGMPAHWMPTDRWVGFGTVDAVTQATCPGCVAARNDAAPAKVQKE